MGIIIGMTIRSVTKTTLLTITITFSTLTIIFNRKSFNLGLIIIIPTHLCDIISEEIGGCAPISF